MLKVMGWWGVVGLQCGGGPIRFQCQPKAPWFFGFGVWGQGLTKELGLEPEGIVPELESMTNDRTYGVEPEDMV